MRHATPRSSRPSRPRPPRLDENEAAAEAYARPVSATSWPTGRSRRRRSSPRSWRSDTCSATTSRRGSGALEDAIHELDAVAAGPEVGGRPCFGSKPACRPRTCSTGAWSSRSSMAGRRSRWPSGSATPRPSCMPWSRVGADLVFAGHMAEGWDAMETGIERARAANLEDDRGARLPDARIVRVGPRRVRPCGGLAARGHRLRRARRALEPSPLHGGPSRARPVGDRAMGRGRGHGDPRARRRPRRDHDPDHGPPRARLRRPWPRRSRTRGRDASGRPAAAEAMRELQRLSPAIWGLAEVRLLAGDPGGSLVLCDGGPGGLGRGRRRGLPVPVPGHRHAGAHPVAATSAPPRRGSTRSPLGCGSGTSPARVPPSTTRPVSCTSPPGRASVPGPASKRPWRAGPPAGASGRHIGALTDLATAHLRANRPADAVRIAGEAVATPNGSTARRSRPGRGRPSGRVGRDTRTRRSGSR